MRLTPAQLHRAAKVAEKIAALELAREEAEDFPTVIELGGPTAQNPLGKTWQAEVAITIDANSIRIALIEQLTPLYSELRSLGVDLQLK